MAVNAALSNASAVVTGATGFIGSRLVERLIGSGADVHAIVRPGSNAWRLAPFDGRVRSHAMDLRDRASVARLMRQVKPRHVFHLATYRSTEPEWSYRDAYETNVFGLLHLIEAAAPGECRFIHFASSTEYGPRTVPSSEDDALVPTTLHGVTKAAAALLCRQYAATMGLRIIVLRLFHVYGPWDRPTRFIPAAIKAALHGGRIPVTPDGYRHDWTYVEDVIDGALAAATLDVPAGETINIASGQDWPNEEILRRISKLSGREINVEERPFPPRPWDGPRWVADVRKAARLLNWTPAHDLDAGLTRTIDWFRSNGRYDAS